MHPEYYRFFRNRNCSDESFFQTLVMNSPYVALREDYLHYIVWNKGKNNPEILTMKDYRDMIGSDKLMARKFDENTDKRIIEQLIQKVRESRKTVDGKE